jgi:hypothetical protein
MRCAEFLVFLHWSALIMPQNNIRITRSQPFFWISKQLVQEIKPSWKALVAYNALAYFSISESCHDVSIAKMAQEFNVSLDTMRRGLQELRKKKAIAVKEHRKKGSREQLPNEYILIDLAGKPQPI